MGRLVGGGGSNQLISSISSGVIEAEGRSEDFVYFVDTSLCRLQFQEEKAQLLSLSNKLKHLSW